MRKMQERFEYGKAKDYDNWYFQLKSPKGEIIFQSNSYDSKEDCLIGIKKVIYYSKKADIVYEEEIEQY